MEWRFEEISPQTTKVDPSHLEFFRSEALDDPVSALVREDIQNRLDAKRNGVSDPVRVEYHLSDSGSMVARAAGEKYLEGLEQHFNSAKVLEELSVNSFDFDQDLPFLVIEDFNTTGLRGNPNQTSDPEDDTVRNDFYWFIRNVGRTGKKAGDRGRWGLGKIVYPASSDIRSFYAYSVRENDHEPALIGRSVLAIHSFEGKEFQSEGYFALFPNPELPFFAVPEHSSDAISSFKETFGITRPDTEPGLSLVIPFPDESISYESLVSSVIHHYFWEILRDNLEVGITCGDRSTTLTKDTIDDIVLTWNGFDETEKRILRNRMEFCKAADELSLGNSDQYFILSTPSAYGSPKTKELFADGKFDQAKALFQDGQIVALECVVEVEKKGDPLPRKASFLVYLQRDSELPRPDETFIRDGLTIIGENYIREPGLRALVLAEDPVLSEFLGDAENPAHTKWLHTTKHFRGKYSPGKALLDYVKYSALKLANQLGRVEDETLEDLLDDIFGIPTEEDSPRPAPPKKKTTKKKIAIRTRNQYLEVGLLKSRTGFAVTPCANATASPERVSIRVAYEVETGNPFSSYHPADFDFSDGDGPVEISLQGCSELQRDPNRLQIQIDSDDFRIEVTGFDPNRDLRIDARAVPPNSTDSEES